MPPQPQPRDSDTLLPSHPTPVGAGWWRVVLPLLLCAGCWLRHREEEISPLQQAILDAEAIFARRAEGPEVLDASIEAWRAALSMAQDEPRVLAGLARAYSARAYGYGLADPAMDYEIGRSYAWSCLMLDSGFSARVNAEGGRLSERAARLLGETYRPCLEAMLIASVRWVELRGPAAAIDLPELTILANRAGEGSPTSWVGPWARGMIVALTPDPARRDNAAMDLAFAEAERALPELWIAAADRLFYAPEPDEARRTALIEQEPAGDWSLENAAALRRLSASRQ